MKPAISASEIVSGIYPSNRTLLTPCPLPGVGALHRADLSPSPCPSPGGRGNYADRKFRKYLPQGFGWFSSLSIQDLPQELHIKVLLKTISQTVVGIFARRRDCRRGWQAKRDTNFVQKAPPEVRRYRTAHAHSSPTPDRWMR